MLYHKIRWTSEKINQRLRLVDSHVYRVRQPLRPFQFRALNSNEKIWVEVPPDTYWGGVNTDFELRTTFRIPKHWGSDGPVALTLPIGIAGDFSHPEALIFIDGQAYAACDRHHQEVILSSEWLDGETHDLLLRGWTGGTKAGRFDPTGHPKPERAARLMMGLCEIVQIHQPTRDFVALARVALGVADYLDENHPSRAHLFNSLDEAFKGLDIREPIGDGFYISLPRAYQILHQGVERAGPPMDVDITAVGHAHIDVAWLWTLAQTRQKAGRTFYNALRLMERFPEFRFVQSQPQLYDFVRQDFPALFSKIQRRVKDGQWEVLGGMWVEADCNLSGGESLVRQFLLGRTFFREHFGADAEAPVLWLPDVFGYAWNLPQLIKDTGLEYFFTIKIGWSQYNRLPYDSFWWQGLDGTRVLTHFSTTNEPGSTFVGTYNAMATPAQTHYTWENFQQKDWGKSGNTPPILMAFGWGDGGGGPTREMLENVRLMNKFPATPQIHPGTVAEFFRKLETEVGDRLPIWNGELYLEYHRGTYTTQARNKRANRKSEFLLHDAEFLGAVSATLSTSYEYPHEDLRQAWELVCLNLFHDIIPGSSIGEVYVESLQQYREVKEIGERVRDSALDVIASNVGGNLLVVNATSFFRRDLAFLPAVIDGTLVFEDGTPLRTQTIRDGMLLDVGEVPPYSVTALHISGAPPRRIMDNPLKITSTCLENAFLQVTLNDEGDITRIFDKTNRRDVLPPGEIANQFQAFEDLPKTPDAWEIDIFYDDKVWFADPAESVEVVENGPLRGTLEIRRRILNSEIIQRISLTHNSCRLDFDTTVQWHERHILLKTAFPVDILSPVATYEIQWGNVERPTHRNTSWDWARFETCAQKWVDLSEGDYGVSLLNDCKYGHDIHRNVIRLTLLRGSTDPDPDADLGEHCFAYALLPHVGNWHSDTTAEAYAFNNPLLVWENKLGSKAVTSGKGLGRQKSFFRVDVPNVIIETVKIAEDGRGVIVRLYESQRKRGPFTLLTSFPISEAWRTNLLEENLEPFENEETQVKAYIKPYQILTFRLIPGPHT
jgi:alpha-mannosidase